MIKKFQFQIVKLNLSLLYLDAKKIFDCRFPMVKSPKPIEAKENVKIATNSYGKKHRTCRSERNRQKTKSVVKNLSMGITKYMEFIKIYRDKLVSLNMI